MNKKYSVAMLTLAIARVTFAGCNLPPADQPQILSIKAIDGNTTAGTRESTTKLIMVNSGSSRTATITVTTSGDIASGYPKWSGISATDGSSSASFSGSLDKTITVEVKDSSGNCSATKTIDIDIWPETETTVAFDSDKLKSFEKVVTLCLALIGESSMQPKFSANFDYKTKFVDFYNDGGKAGVYNSINGSASLSVGTVDKEVIIPTSVPGVSFSIGGKITGFQTTINSGLKYDESKSNPWVASEATISGGASASVFGELVLGINKDKGEDSGVIGKIEGSTQISASGSLKGKGDSVVADYKVVAGTLKVTLSCWVKVQPLFQMQIAKKEYEFFKGQTFEPEEAVTLFEMK